MSELKDLWGASARPGEPTASSSLCGPGCRYRGMYEAAEKSLEDMTENHRRAIETHKELRDGLVAVAKRLFRGEVTEIERRGHKFSDLSDAALLMHLEGFIAELLARRRGDYGEMESLRAVLTQKGYELPDNHDIRAWVAALSVQQEFPRAGFPASVELAQSFSDIDEELRKMLEAEGMTVSAEPTEPRPPAATPRAPAAEEDGEDLADLFSDETATPELGDRPAPTSTPAGRAEPATTTGTGSGEGEETPDVPDPEESDNEEESLELDVGVDEPDVDALWDDDWDSDNPSPDLGDLLSEDNSEEVEPEIFDVDASTETETPAAEEAAQKTSEHEAGTDLADLFGGGSDEVTDSAGDAGADLVGLFTTPDPRPEPVPASDDAPRMVPAGEEDLAALFGDTVTGSDTPEDDDEPNVEPAASEGGQRLRAPNPAFLTPEEAAGSRLRPEIIGVGETRPASKPKKPEERRRPKERAIRPDPIRFDLPEADAPRVDTELSEELSKVLLAAVEVTKPVFMSELAGVAGSQELAEAWEAQMRSVDNPPVRFLSARSHHRSRGSLVLPHRLRTEPTPEFEKSWWGQTLASGHRGNVLYEIAVLLSAYSQYIVSVDIGDDVVTMRANLPHGLTGIILVAGDDLGEGGQTRAGLVERVEALMSERLATIMVLAVRRGREDALVELLADEGRRREWRPAMPIAVDLSWSYAAGRASTAKLALGGG